MILLTGATGYIGRAFAIELAKRELAFTPLSRAELDYTRFDVLFNYVRSTRPAFVINAAGYTGRPDTDACETHRAETIRANTLLPQTIARVCYLTNTPWGHVSSGCIYAGAKIARPDGLRVERDPDPATIRSLSDAEPETIRGFSESDVPNVSFHSHPCSFYSGSKALAEEALQWTDQGYLWRPRPVFDEEDHPRNYLSWIQRNGTLPDGLNSLSHRGDFVKACLDLWERRAPFGTYNIVNAGTISSRELAGMMQRIRRPEQNAQGEGSTGGKGADTCILDNSKLTAAGIQMRPVHEALAAALQNWQPQTLNFATPAAFQKAPHS